MVPEQGRVPGRADAGGVVDVLEADRDAVQRAFPVARSDVRLGLAGRRQRWFLQHQQMAVEHAIQLLHARQEQGGQLDGGNLSFPDQCGCLRDGQPVRVGHAATFLCRQSCSGSDAGEAKPIPVGVRPVRRREIFIP
jgi:hypothetical protein